MDLQPDHGLVRHGRPYLARSRRVFGVASAGAPRRTALPRGAPELEDHFVRPDHAELASCDPFDRGRIVTEARDLDMQPLDVAAELFVLLRHVVELALEPPQTRKPLRLEHQERHGNQRERKNGNGQRSTKQNGRRRHDGPTIRGSGCRGTLLYVRSPRRRGTLRG
jgi:hypothetical protein